MFHYIALWTVKVLRYIELCKVSSWLCRGQFRCFNYGEAVIQPTNQPVSLLTVIIAYLMLTVFCRLIIILNSRTHLALSRIASFMHKLWWNLLCEWHC